MPDARRPGNTAACITSAFEKPASKNCSQKRPSRPVVGSGDRNCVAWCFHRYFGGSRLGFPSRRIGVLRCSTVGRGSVRILLRAYTANSGMWLYPADNSCQGRVAGCGSCVGIAVLCHSHGRIRRRLDSADQCIWCRPGVLPRLCHHRKHMVTCRDTFRLEYVAWSDIGFDYKWSRLLRSGLEWV